MTGVPLGESLDTDMYNRTGLWRHSKKMAICESNWDAQSSFSHREPTPLSSWPQTSSPHLWERQFLVFRQLRKIRGKIKPVKRKSQHGQKRAPEPPLILEELLADAAAESHCPFGGTWPLVDRFGPSGWPHSRVHMGSTDWTQGIIDY